VAGRGWEKLRERERWEIWDFGPNDLDYYSNDLYLVFILFFLFSFFVKQKKYHFKKLSIKYTK
jgi:hypothetical protein